MSNGPVIRKAVPSVELGELGQMLQALRSDILEDVDNKLQKGIDKIVKELECRQRKLQNGFIEKSSSAKEIGRPKELPTKEFALRNTTLANRWENPDVRSLYNCVFAVFILLYIYIAIFYCLNVQRFKDDIAVVSWTFSKFHIVAATWLAINLSIVFFLHPVFRFWAANRAFVKNKGLYDSMFCILFILYSAAMYIIPAGVIIACNVPPISSFMILLEQIRLFMKSYAFVRENIPRALKYKPHQDGDKEDLDSYPCPKVEKLVYFLFAPTLIYRDSYPRTSHIRWNYVGWHLLQVIFSVLGYFIAFIWFAVNTFNKAGIEPIPFVHFVGALAMSVFAGAIIMFMGFYCTLHCVQEAVGEMLRFGDRRFYDDWWNCTSFAQFYRSWNTLVQDWLYSYIYRDMYIILGRSRTGATLTVFLISAVVHEYVLALVCKFLVPLLFIKFITFGVLLVFITRRQTSSFWNVYLWWSLFQGYGLLLVFYTLEWYSRINCPRIIDSWEDYFVPRSFSCNLISWPS